MTSLAAPGDLLPKHSRNDGASENDPLREPSHDSDDGFRDNLSLSKTNRISRLAKKAKAKTKKFLKVDGTATNIDAAEEEDGPLQAIDQDPAFNPSQISKSKQSSPSVAAEKTRDAVKSVGSAIAHPKDAIKGKITQATAGQLSKTDRPYLSKDADLDYLRAHDNLKRVESTTSSSRGEASDEDNGAIVGHHKDKLREIEAQRESLRVAWTTSRHVRRVRVVPKRHMNLPQDDFFVQRDANGHHVRYDWLKWLGYRLLYYTQDFSAQYIDDFDELPFSVDSSRHYVERLVMASAPWQSWAMKVRSVYRWEEPRTTGKWFALYILLWYTEHIMGFLYGYIIYFVIKNRFYPTSVESIRHSMQRAQDSRSNAYGFSELIDKHGDTDWLEPLIANLGPYLQLQLGDIANMLEVFSNFYHWKSPRKTVATLTFFAACLLVSVFADMAFCVKIVYFVAGGSFFLCFPIASRYPKYRYLVSPFKWMLWDIPTHAEWSFQYLRRRGQEARQRMIEHKVGGGHSRGIAKPALPKHASQFIVPELKIDGDDAVEVHGYESDDSGFYSACSTASVLDSSDIRSFHAHFKGSVGRFFVFSKGIRFVRNLRKKELWRYNYLDIMEMRKVEGTPISKVISSPDQMQIKCIDGTRLSLEGLRERDEAFNTVIAFSSLQWQSLQIREDTADQEM